MPVILSEDERHFAEAAGYPTDTDQQRATVKFAFYSRMEERHREPIRTMAQTAPIERLKMYLSWLAVAADSLEKIEDQIPVDISREIFSIRNVKERIERKLGIKEPERKATLPQFGAVIPDDNSIPMTRARLPRKLKLDT